jgi:ketosteroid isomerase-like protein
MRPTPIVLALCLALQSSTAVQPAGGDAAGRRAVEALEARWLAAEQDAAALDDILADDFVHVLPQGIVTKAEQLAFMRAHPAPEAGGTRRFEDLRVRVFGTAAVATGIVVATARDGTVQKTAFTDVFAYRGGRWRAVNAQETPLQEPRRRL